MPYLILTEKSKATTKPWFSRFPWHLARKQYGFILGHKTHTHAYLLTYLLLTLCVTVGLWLYLWSWLVPSLSSVRQSELEVRKREVRVCNLAFFHFHFSFPFFSFSSPSFSLPFLCVFFLFRVCPSLDPAGESGQWVYSPADKRFPVHSGLKITLPIIAHLPRIVIPLFLRHTGMVFLRKQLAVWFWADQRYAVMSYVSRLSDVGLRKVPWQ